MNSIAQVIAEINAAKLAVKSLAASARAAAPKGGCPMSAPRHDSSGRPTELVNPETGKTVVRFRCIADAECYLEENGDSELDLYHDGVLVRSGLDYETAPCDGPSDADPGL